MAQTHLEVYRRFQGELRPHPLRFWPILAANLRVGLKKKLPLFLLYAVPGIATVIFCFIIYGKFVAEETLLPELGGGGGITKLLAARATQALEVRNLIVNFNTGTAQFALLVVVWYGSGLFVEDRRAGAHQLYFSRPITRFDYFLGKFLTVAFFAALAMLVPGLVLCVVATFSSPEWSFIKNEGDVILRTIAYAAVWSIIVCSITLAASSIVPRRSFAMVAVFGLFMISFPLGNILAELQDSRFLVLSLPDNLSAISLHIFDMDVDTVEPSSAWTFMGVLTALSLAIVALRLKRLEVVA